MYKIIFCLRKKYLKSLESHICIVKYNIYIYEYYKKICLCKNEIFL